MITPIAGYLCNKDRFLYDPKILRRIKKEEICIPYPKRYSQFFSLSEPHEESFMYGSLFEPHTDSKQEDEDRWGIQFYVWRKDCVMFREVNRKIEIIEPTLKLITFDFTKPHGFIPRVFIPFLKSRKITKDDWKQIAEDYEGNLLFISSEPNLIISGRKTSRS